MLLFTCDPVASWHESTEQVYQLVLGMQGTQTSRNLGNNQGRRLPHWVAIDEASHSCASLHTAVAHSVNFSICRCLTACTLWKVCILGYMMVSNSTTAAWHAFSFKLWHITNSTHNSFTISCKEVRLGGGLYQYPVHSHSFKWFSKITSLSEKNYRSSSRCRCTWILNGC